MTNMRRRILPLVALACVAAWAEESKAPKPVLVHAGEACFVHAVRAVAEPDHVERLVAPGWAVLRTDRKTGEMHYLVPPTGTYAINTVRISFAQARILGLAVDDERLYALTWSAPRIFDDAPAPDAPLAGGTYRLQVFWLADGREIASPALAAAKLPATAPMEVVDRGPLELVPGGVSVYGVAARYDGKQLRR